MSPVIRLVQQCDLRRCATRYAFAARLAFLPELRRCVLSFAPTWRNWSRCQPIQVAAQENLVIVPSTSDSVAQRSEEPEDQPYDEHNRPDCPHDGNTRDKSNDE